MIANTLKNINEKIQGRIKFRTVKSLSKEITLNKVYILPSGFGWAVVVSTICIATGAINYQLNTVLILVFMFFIIGILSMWETNRNLKGLTITSLPMDDVQQGQPLKVALLIRGDELTRFGLAFCFDSAEVVKLDKLTKEDEQLIIPFPTPKRGHFTLSVIQISTYYPFGLFRAWGYMYFDNDYYVYPRAVDPGYWPDSGANISHKETRIDLQGEDDLYELKSTKNPWVHSGRIAWKISARGQGWYLKSMTSPAGENWLFRIEDFKSKDTELNLQQLSFWIQNAETHGHLYGLELRGQLTEISRGKLHLQRCLRQLATY